MRADDLRAIERALALIEGVPASQFPNESSSERGKIRAELQATIKPLYPVIERLQAEFMPEASSSGPLACHSGVLGNGTPLSNFLRCYDLCVHCHAEVKRALVRIREGLQGTQFSGPFLSPEEKFARAKQYEARALVEVAPRGKAPSAREFRERSLALARRQASASLPVLTEDATVFRDILLENGPQEAVIGPRLCKLFEERTSKGMDESEFRTSIVGPLKAWGLKNKPKVGYYFPADAPARRHG